MKKIIKLIIFILAIFLFDNKVNAESFSKRELPNIYITRENEFGDNSSTISELIYNNTNGKVVYNINPFTRIDTDETYTKHQVEDYELNLSPEQIRRIELIIHFGYGYDNRDEEEWYAATQSLIWDTILGKNKTYVSDSQYGDEIEELRTYKLMIQQDVDKYQSLTLKDETIRIKYNEIKRINIESYTLEDDYSIAVRNNYMETVMNDLYDYTYKLTRGSLEKNYIYKSNLYELIEVNGLTYEEVEYWLKSDYTTFTISSEEDENIYSNCNNSKIYNKYGLYDNEDNLIGTFSRNELIKILPYGKYYIKQISNTCDTILDKTKYYYDISDDNQDISDYITEKKIGKKININLIHGYLNNYEYEQGAVFRVSDDKNYFDIETDEKGNASIILGCGKYNIKQISGNKNYIFNDDFNIEIDSNTKELTYNIINEIPTYNLSVILQNQNEELIEDFKTCLYNENNELINCGKEYNNLIEGNYILKIDELDDYVVEDKIINLKINNNASITIKCDKRIIEEPIYESLNNIIENNEKEIYVLNTSSYSKFNILNCIYLLCGYIICKKR